MCGKLERLIKQGRVTAGFTITEVVVASALLVIAVVPILKALTIAHVTSSVIERKTRSLMLAEAKLDRIRAHSIYNYSETFAEENTNLGDSYRCTVVDTAINSNLRSITVMVGYNLNGDSQLSADEIGVTLRSYVARRR